MSVFGAAGLSSLTFAVANGSIGGAAVTVGLSLYRTLLETITDGARRSAGERWFGEFSAKALSKPRR
jgi:hypothetical protein